MLRTSRRPSNYWGLVQQRGPWAETAIDLDRLKESRTYKLGGGVPDGGTEHAGHAYWSSTMNPNPQFQNLPPMPNPSTYAQIYNLIPGPPQIPPLPGRPPLYVFRNPNDEKQGTFHQHLTQPRVPTDALPGVPIPPEIKEIQDMQIHRDLVTGPFGHSYDYTETPEMYSEHRPSIPTYIETPYRINAQLPPSRDREPRLMLGSTSSSEYSTPLSVSTSSIFKGTPREITSQMAQHLTNLDVALKTSNDQSFKIITEDLINLAEDIGIDTSEAKSEIMHLFSESDLETYGLEILQILLALNLQTNLWLYNSTTPSSSTSSIITSGLGTPETSETLLVSPPGQSNDIIFNPGFNETTTQIPEISGSVEMKAKANSLGINVSQLKMYDSGYESQSPNEENHPKRLRT